MNRRARILAYETGTGQPRIYTVGELADAVRAELELEFGTVLVQGEISGYKIVGSGHHYFQLKDERAQIEVALFKSQAARLRGPLANGMAVQVEGDLTAYAPRSQYQIVASRVTPVGYGALQAQFEALKRRLEAEGLFDPARKRPLPAYPTRIALVTSLTGAAIRDMLRILRSRAPYATVTVAATRVQGEGAAQEIADAIDLVNAWGGAEILLVGRGGGSPQDLWAFNEEVTVRAIARSRVPVISAIGHQADTTLADLAADRRAATPTHAAQLAVKDPAEIRATLVRASENALRLLRLQTGRARSQLRALRDHHALREPARRIQHGVQTLDHAETRLRRALEGWVALRQRRLDRGEGRLRAHTPERLLERARDRIAALGARAVAAVESRRRGLVERVGERARLLASFDHRRVLGRGYALVWSEGGARLVHRGKGLVPDQPVEIQFHDARAAARILGIARAQEEER